MTTLREISKQITEKRNRLIVHEVMVRRRPVKEVAKRFNLAVNSIYTVIYRDRMKGFEKN